MMPLSAVVADVLAQLKLTEAGVQPGDCRLTLKGKVVDQTTPVRFANIGRDKLELHTGEGALYCLWTLGDGDRWQAGGWQLSPARQPAC